jgi:hypothetical protein
MKQQLAMLWSGCHVPASLTTAAGKAISKRG